MAVNANVYHSNAIQGIPGVSSDINLYRVDTVPQFAMGHLLETQDGRRFRYAHIGTAEKQGALMSQDISESGAALNDITVVAPASAATTPRIVISSARIALRITEPRSELARTTTSHIWQPGPL